MFELEEDSIIKIEKIKSDDYDLSLGFAISNSLKKKPGSQILSPEEIQKRVEAKVKEFLNFK